MKNGLRRCDIRLTSTGNVAGAVAEPLLKDPLLYRSQGNKRESYNPRKHISRQQALL